MNPILRMASESARQVLQAQAVSVNNLANASTSGFKAELVRFTAEDAGQETEGLRRLDVVERNSPDFKPGVITTTGRDLDVAVDGDGWIAVAAPDGSEVYTRRGDLQIDALGQLTNGAGQPVLGNGGPIVLPPFAKLEIGTDGTVSILPLGGSSNTLATVNRIKLVRIEDGGLGRDQEGLMRLRRGVVAEPDASIGLVRGALEGSNANAVESLVNMIDLARQFEIQIKLMKKAEENEEALASITRMN